MMRMLQDLLNRTPAWSSLRRLARAIGQKRKLRDWERRGRPVPPPHIVKQRAIRELAGRFGVKVLVETGTFNGDMVEAMKDSFSRIYSIELSRGLYEKATRRFAGDDRIRIIHGDSGSELGRLTARLDQPALFWLDGHYSGGVTARGDKDTPIHEELTHIFRSPQKGHVILIDDARYFGTDPAYPQIGELMAFIKAHKPDATTEVEKDMVRILPPGAKG